MRQSLLAFLIPVLFLQLQLPVNGQQMEYPINKWVDALSIKKDIRSDSYRGVFNELQALDSVRYCQVNVLLKERSEKENIRYRIRLKLLESQLQLNERKCSSPLITVEELLEALQTAYEIDDDWLKFELHNNLSTIYTKRGSYGSAAMHAMSAIDLAEKLGRDNLYVTSGDWYALGYVLYHSREYAASIKASRIALATSSKSKGTEADTLNVNFQTNALNTIGLCYEKLEKPDSAFWAFDQALTLMKKQSNDFWRGIIIGNKGDVYFKMGRYDSAEVMLSYDYKQSVAASQFDNAANSLQWLARIELSKGNALEALQMLREAQRYLQRIPQKDYEVNVLYAFTQVFSRMGDADSLNVYMNQYLMVHDSIEKAANDNRLEVVRMRMENQTSVNKVISMSKEKRQISLIRNFIIAVLLLIAFAGFMVLNRQRLKLKLKEQEALESKRVAQRDATQAREQLDVFTKHLVEKTGLVETLQEQLLKKELNEEQILRIAELSQHTILTDDDWDQFRNMFEKVYPGFFHSLRQRSSDITLAELRMAALCKLQVPAKEAANLLGISPNSVNKTRQRLRTRLGLDPDANLETYFSE